MIDLAEDGNYLKITGIKEIDDERRAALDAGEAMFLGIPETWYWYPKWRCKKGHIYTSYMQTDAGGICMECICYNMHSPVYLTFPEDDVTLTQE